MVTRGTAEALRPLYLVHKYTIISDDKDYIKAVSSLSQTNKAYSFAELFADGARFDLQTSPDLCTHLWIDLPRGARWKASKVDGVREKVEAFIHQYKRLRPIVMLTPWGNGHKRIFPHKRWSKLLSLWRPSSASYCACQLLPKQHGNMHIKIRAFASGLSLTGSDCKHQAVTWNKPWINKLGGTLYDALHPLSLSRIQ